MPLALQAEEEQEPQILTASDILKKRFTSADGRTMVTVGGESIFSFDMEAVFYQKRSFEPAWAGPDGHFLQADDLITAIQKAHQEGLIPEYYHINAIQSLLLDQVRTNLGRTAPNFTAIADLDALLTDSFLLLSCHLSKGCINPIMRTTEWFAANEKIDVTTLLEDSLREKRVKEALQSLTPHEKLYSRLRQALERYRQLANRNDSWPLIPPEKPSIKIDMNDRRIPVIRHRLITLGDLPSTPQDNSSLYDQKLARAVSAFQQRHGLEADGIIGANTITALNISPEKRARQIELNMERLRWSFRNPGERYILVNIANFSLDVIENDMTVMNMKVVVGKPFWDTPVFSGKMRYLVLNPSWTIPRNIAVEEILPKVLNDRQYLLKNDIMILRNGKVIEGSQLKEIDWYRLNIDYFPYQLRQQPGPKNPLGNIKFIFPNQFDVYLHDSPHKGLFQRNVRAFSHGCIRIEN